jgi:hypothetical protein
MKQILSRYYTVGGEQFLPAWDKDTISQRSDEEGIEKRRGNMGWVCDVREKKKAELKITQTRTLARE